MESITLTTKHITIITIFKYMPSTTLTSHCTHIEIHTQHQEQTRKEESKREIQISHT